MTVLNTMLITALAFCLGTAFGRWRTKRKLLAFIENCANQDELDEYSQQVENAQDLDPDDPWTEDPDAWKNR